VELEEVPRLMMMGPVFKGGGRDPQLIDSYNRGITVIGDSFT
jgi:hypothetical protein